MGLLDLLSQKSVWETFYAYKAGLACSKAFLRDLRVFIDRADYLPVCDAIRQKARFPLPKRAVISKLSSGKKRVVYTYPPAENTVLKLLTYLLLRQYDGVFSGNLFSFRPGKSAKDAVRMLTHVPGIRTMAAYKADVSDYFNSIPVDRLLPKLRAVTEDDPALYDFLSALLTEPQVLDNGCAVTEQKGFMAGTPLSAFFANLFLNDLDRHFASAGVPYARYSDDIILFAGDADTLDRHAAFVREFLSVRGLSLNPEKEQTFSPADGWVFLGFWVRDGGVDLAPASIKKLKQKMRRKTRALQRWQKRKGLDGMAAAKAFIRVFHRKLFENPAEHELTWTRWFFPVLTKADGLHEIDRYAQDCIRVLAGGTHTKARFNVRYADLKRLGYRSLVHEYYVFKKTGEENNAAVSN